MIVKTRITSGFLTKIKGFYFVKQRKKKKNMKMQNDKKKLLSKKLAKTDLMHAHAANRTHIHQIQI